MYQSTHTGAQVDEAVDKVLASPISVMSNRNLLDNPWFTVNQRGFTSTSTNNTYTADRWLAQNLRTNGVISLTNGIVTIDATNAVGGSVTFGQAVDEAEVGQRPVTLSVMLSSGEIYSATGTIPARTASQQTVIDSLIGTTQCYMRLYLRETSAATPYLVQFVVPIGATLAIKAVKLELGSVSTLANDTTPNYAEELAKCQRYFTRMVGYFTAFRTASSAVPYEARVQFPVPMRATPTISNVAFVGSGSVDGTDAYQTMVRFYKTSETGFVVSSFNASADL